MMTPEQIVDLACVFALVVLGIAFLMTVWRAVVGPTLPDRIIALDMLVGIVIGFIAVIALRTGYLLYVDIAISLGLVGFLATVAFARFILARGSVGTGEGRDLNGFPDNSKIQSKVEKKTRATKSAKASSARRKGGR